MTSLDLLLLLLIHRGTNTPYLLRSRAGISLGASLPALKRLLGNRFIKKSKPGQRGKREFALTPAGHSQIANISQHLQSALAQPVTDVDSALRLAACAIFTGSSEVAVELLQKSADDFDRRSGKVRNALPEFQTDELPDLYAAATARCEADRLQSSASSLRVLASDLEKHLLGKKVSRRNPQKPGK
jgi:DNA-binding PadR family transcriptional regulator